MEQLLTTLPYLACPLGMGLMMWLMMRGTSGGSAATVDPHQIAAPQTVQSGQRPRPEGGLMAHLGMCLNWKVVGGLAAAGVLLWVAVPSVLTAAVPIVLVLACPLSMIFMMRGTPRRSGMQGDDGQHERGGACTVGAGERPIHNEACATGSPAERECYDGSTPGKASTTGLTISSCCLRSIGS